MKYPVYRYSRNYMMLRTHIDCWTTYKNENGFITKEESNEDSRKKMVKFIIKIKYE